MKMKARLAVVISLAVVLATSAFAETATLINSGFENNWTSSIVSMDGRTPYYSNPTGPDMGWTFAGGAVSATLGSPAYEGNRFAVLWGTASISQSFAVASNSSATLDFVLAERGGYPGQTVGVYVDGNQVAEYAAWNLPVRWNLEHVNLGNLTTGSHILQFKGNAQAGNSGTAFLDAVKINVTPVPEPETYAMLMAGLGLVGFVVRRKKSV